jgi:hypothetical protein
MYPLIQFKTLTLSFFAVVVLSCFAVLPVAQGSKPSPTPTPVPTPTPTPTEDRGNGNSAAEGVAALNPGTTGANNTAHGWFALSSNTTGIENTAAGYQALYSNTTGNDNTASGFNALFSNTTAGANTATGAYALLNNNSGGNTAIGFQVLINNTSGFYNTGIGLQALLGNTVGVANTAVGQGALVNNSTGSNNVALGAGAGQNVLTASGVTSIGHVGADVDNTTWIASVYGVTTVSGTTAPVVVSDGGQLGTVASSERFKKDIATMEKASEAILLLRPVTFHYKTDTKGTPQFGLIAEEVAKVNPALVLPDKEGKPFTVRYDAVNAMLLNEFLKEHKTVQEQSTTMTQQRKDFEAATAQQQKQIDALTATVREQAAQIQKVSAELEVNKTSPQTVLNYR